MWAAACIAPKTMRSCACTHPDDVSCHAHTLRSVHVSNSRKISTTSQPMGFNDEAQNEEGPSDPSLKHRMKGSVQVAIHPVNCTIWSVQVRHNRVPKQYHLGAPERWQLLWQLQLLTHQTYRTRSRLGLPAEALTVRSVAHA